MDRLESAGLDDLLEAWECVLEPAEREVLYQELEERGYRVHSLPPYPDSSTQLEEPEVPPYLAAEEDTDLARIARSLRIGAQAAYVVAGLRALSLLVNLVSGTSPSTYFTLLTYEATTVIIFAGCAFGLSRGSRVAGLVLCLIFGVELAAALLLTRHPLVLVVGGCFLFSFFLGTRSAFEFHSENEG